MQKQQQQAPRRGQAGTPGTRPPP
ncbi:Protein of unknown function [Pyronema omphalodes CBS 100304]|uniref:Uncharacterized protein n=1 Tax=Pyronema omphalodes (strain CBS 100304) TaxID=1076935 RepID=U4KU53_PYROM|nr:Protein of unknown function [Pyronema omphalodes CBS 100304]